MKKGAAIIFILLLGSSTFNNEQNIGYLGRNFSVEVENFFMPALTFYKKNEEDGIALFNNRHGLKLAYTLSKDISAGMKFSFYKTKVRYQQQYDLKKLDRNNDTFIATQMNTAFSELTGTNLGVFIKFSLDEIYQPLGEYLQIGVQRFGMQSSYDREDFKHRTIEGGPKDAYLMPEKEEYSYSRFGLSAAYGNRRVLTDYLFIDYAAQLNILYAPEAFNNSFAITANEPKDLVRQKTINRAIGFNSISLKLGIGYLPF